MQTLARGVRTLLQWWPLRGIPAPSPPHQMAAITRRDTAVRDSEATICNGVVYLAGQVPDAAATESGDITKQTESVLRNIDALLARSGSDKSRILMASIFLADIRDAPAMNAVWEKWVPSGAAPSRATVGSTTLVDPRWRIEIVITAAVSA